MYDAPKWKDVLITNGNNAVTLRRIVQNAWDAYGEIIIKLSQQMHQLVQFPSLATNDDASNNDSSDATFDAFNNVSSISLINVWWIYDAT